MPSFLHSSLQVDEDASSSVTAPELLNLNICARIDGIGSRFNEEWISDTIVVEYVHY
jgi:hypothetical protein